MTISIQARFARDNVKSIEGQSTTFTRTGDDGTLSAPVA
jgi:hypothetical protein